MIAEFPMFFVVFAREMEAFKGVVTAGSAPKPTVFGPFPPDLHPD